MSQQLRQRSRAAAAIGILFAGAPLSMARAGYADPTPAARGPVQESGHEVVFTGDSLFGVSCAATPSVTSLTVPAESTVRVVNNTGRRARLLIDDAIRGEIGDGVAAEVLFHRGPVSLALKPDCVVAEESSVRIEVVPATQPPRVPASPAGQGRSPAATGGARRPATSAKRGAAEGTAVPDGATSGAVDEPVRSTDAVDWGAPADASAGAVSGADSPAEPRGGGAAAEPIASVDPVREAGPLALLALIATISIVGVSAGAIRAILAQRATRTAPA